MTEQQFTCQLMSWHTRFNKREMPWKGEKDPYKIWLSEVILQQTRVEQGWDYYERFIAQYPTVTHLAAAADKEVFKMWEGLGYYNRCKNLLFTARAIANTRQGNFPNSYEELLALKGIGPYTAAAISAFAFNMPYAVVDGNVFRVLARIFGISTATDTTEGKKIFSALAQKVLDKESPASYNQAIMDFGATVCKPAPKCAECTMANICVAFKTAQVNALPVKEKTLSKKTRWFTYLVFKCEGEILIHQRTAKDIWQALHEFYLIETEQKPIWKKNNITTLLHKQFSLDNFQLLHITNTITQKLTHQTINTVFIEISLPQIPETLQHFKWLSATEILHLAFPKSINDYLDNYKL